MRRWATHLSEELNSLDLAIHISLTLGDYTRVLDLLLRQGMTEVASLFARAWEDRLNLFDSAASLSPASKPSPNAAVTSLPLELLSGIYASYATKLARVGLKPAADYYTELSASLSAELASDKPSGEHHVGGDDEAVHGRDGDLNATQQAASVAPAAETSKPESSATIAEAMISPSPSSHDFSNDMLDD